jgi:cysteine desulfurase
MLGSAREAGVLAERDKFDAAKPVGEPCTHDRVCLNGHAEQRLPNTLNVSISGVRGDDLLAETPDVAASTGSACHAGTTEPSPVLHAMGLDRERSLAALRLSLGRWSTEQDIDHAADLLATAASVVQHRPM